jgi:hypothetical protein
MTVVIKNQVKKGVLIKNQQNNATGIKFVNLTSPY